MEKEFLSLSLSLPLSLSLSLSLSHTHTHTNTSTQNFLKKRICFRKEEIRFFKYIFAYNMITYLEKPTESTDKPLKLMKTEESSILHN